MKIDMFLSSATLLTLMSDYEKSLKVSVLDAFFESFGNGRVVTFTSVLTPRLVTPTRLVDLCRMKRLACCLLCSLK